MAECVEVMNGKKIEFLIELGDFKDQDNPADETNTLRYLAAIEEVFQEFNGRKYHVVGNHDVDSISKMQFQEVIRNTNIPAQSTYYSFDLNELHFIVLDANFSADGTNYDNGNFDWTDSNIPDEECEWLVQDLASTFNPVIVFVHQRLDGAHESCVRNAARVRQILHENRILAVFQGHHHAGYYSRIEGIHYYTLKAMVDGCGAENSSYAIVDVHQDHSITVTGYRRAVSSELGNESEKSIYGSILPDCGCSEPFYTIR
jgi:hypothetical protein